MNQTDNILAIIPARGGSKRLPGKNIRPLGGLPMLAWSIRAAQRSQTIDRLILSSDDEVIIEVARGHGCEVPFRRSEQLAQDEATTVDVIVDALDRVADRYAYVVILQPTSPLRTAADIDAAVELCRSSGAASCVSVTQLSKPESFYALVDATGRLAREAVFANHKGAVPALINGAVYVVATEHLRRTGSIYDLTTIAYPMPLWRSIDVDTAQDFAMAECLQAMTHFEAPREDC
jgi:CMP-N-acetylneuraminic acid synthetase